MADDNIALQSDEIEALGAIYGSQWEADPAIKNSFIFRLNAEVQIFITFNKGYPSDNPPDYQLLAPILNKKQKDLVDSKFSEICRENPGASIVFQWIEKLKEIVESNTDTLEEITEKELEKIADIDIIDETKHPNFDVIHGSLIQDRKSVFQGHACSIHHEDEVEKVLEFLKQNRKIAQATHNITAYRIKTADVLYQDYDDDGESHAGQRLLHLLQILDLTNVVVVVSRWYGGIHLGPKRFQHINNAARQVLQEAGFIK